MQTKLFLLIAFLLFPWTIYAQSVDELYKYTPDDWMNLSTDDRLRAINISNNCARNQSFLGKFNLNEDLYKKWGYNYYEMNDSYENYSFHRFEDYRILENRRNKWSYNDFGDRLYKMTHSATIWSDTQNDNGTSSSSGPGGYINYYTGITNLGGQEGAWVIRESTNDWAISAIGADKLRMTLSPLTMSKAALTGMSINYQSANYEAKMVNSIITQGSLSNQMMRGLQLRRKFGVLNLGATYTTNYFQQLGRDKGNDWRGNIYESITTPIIYMVRILDDSPWNGNGPIIYNVRLKVDGVYHDEIIPQVIIDDLGNEKSTAVQPASGGSQNYLINNRVFYDHNIYMMDDVNQPKYVDYLFLNDYYRGWNTKNIQNYFSLDKANNFYKMIDPAGMPFKVDGTKYAVYIFDLSSIKNKVSRVQAEITLSNDYRIQTADVYVENPNGGHDKNGDNIDWYKASAWRTLAVADGNVTDGSNLRTVTVDFGCEVGNVIYGFDGEFNYYGYKIRGEIVKNSHYYMFSDGNPGRGLPLVKVADITARTGHRSSLTDNAWYITAQKNWDKLAFSGEIFRMGKFYRPFFKRYNSDFYDPYTLIDDNDDYDQFPDMEDLGGTQGDGVYPGQDLDNDGIPDNDRNRNGTPDFMEPFLMFDVNPDNFAFGDDFNDNSVPDYREDDTRVDTPYDLDRKGYHTNIKYTPFRSINFITGTLRTRGVGVENRTFNDYAKFNANYDAFNVGNFYAEYRYERIQDNIHDPYIDFKFVPGASSNFYGTGWNTDLKRNLDYKLEYINSEVNKVYLQSKIRALPFLTIENFVKYEINRQLGGTMYDGTYQSKNNIDTFAMSNKIAYTENFGNLILISGIKSLIYKKSYSERIIPEEYYTLRFPLIHFKYNVSSNSSVNLAFQGFNGFEMKYTDYVNGKNDYYQKNYILSFENISNYFGFKIWGSWGFKLEQVDFKNRTRRFENYKVSSFYVKIDMGYE